MIIETADFGKFEFEPQDILHFNSGLYGFENILEYVLINLDEHGSLMCLHPAAGKVPSFIVMDPASIFGDYRPIVSFSDLKELGVQKAEELKYLVIAVVTEDYRNSVVNLKSPIAINPASRQARQIIIENSKYQVRYPLFSAGKGENICL